MNFIPTKRQRPQAMEFDHPIAPKSSETRFKILHAMAIQKLISVIPGRQFPSSGTSVSAQETRTHISKSEVQVIPRNIKQKEEENRQLTSYEHVQLTPLILSPPNFADAPMT